MPDLIIAINEVGLDSWDRITIVANGQVRGDFNQVAAIRFSVLFSDVMPTLTQRVADGAKIAMSLEFPGLVFTPADKVIVFGAPGLVS